jgi:predicted nucleotidyltransferase
MDKTPERTELDDAIVATIRARLSDVLAVYRYGSAGGPFERPDSDLDVALLCRERVPFETRTRVAVDLMKVFDRDVDVVDMRGISVSLRVQIAASGARLYAENRSVADEYDARALSDYARLNEERRDILKDVRARGSIHG